MGLENVFRNMLHALPEFGLNVCAQVSGGSSESWFVPFQTRAFVVVRHELKMSFVICFFD